MSLPPSITAKELLLKACEVGNLDLARVLLATGADISWTDDMDWAGLHYAAYGGHSDLLDLLLEQPRVDVNLMTKYCQTPLMLACNTVGRQGIVQKLLQVQGLHLNDQDTWGQTALHGAVRRGYVQEFRGKPGLNWNVIDGDGETPLLMAARLGLADSLQVILAHLDDIAINNNGQNVSWLAVRNSEEWNSLRCVQLLSDDQRVDWNTRDDAGDTPLLYCLKNNKFEFSWILLKNPRVDHHVQDREGKYPETIAR